ncbi:hypothetical protein Ddye_026111 [Dipteronia dyeriana]|uniref:SWIM-type domain-containing protein n=1 Tax=Dipteronia dyeriana TaxID=168575 RepID=A0AAD9TM46_9ROSI|nr:hypothetical protein Ddye_026111 [Dipteronia dyeriana]
MYVWNATNSNNKNAFMDEMIKLKEVNERAHGWIMQIQLKHRCVHAYDTHVKSEHTTNNITESFNSWVDKYRGYPALMLLESLRRKMMKRMYKRLEDARKWSSNLPPPVAKKLVERQDEGRFMTVLCASDTKYEVKEESKYFIINLITRSCDCGLWEVSGIPCKHAMAVITAKRLSAEDYIDAYLTKAAYLKNYSYVIHPIHLSHSGLKFSILKSYLLRIKGSLAGPKKKRKGVLRSLQNRRGVVQESVHSVGSMDTTSGLVKGVKELQGRR